MIFHQLINEDSGCLSYLIGCGEAGEAAVVDPGRDRVDEYVRLARKKGLRITRILETHTHADHISGNRDLAAVTKASIVLHRSTKAVFEHAAVQDGDEIVIGNVVLKALHTPGHTPDSLCLLVTDAPRARRGTPSGPAAPASSICASPGRTARATCRARSTCGSRALSSAIASAGSPPTARR